MMDSDKRDKSWRTCSIVVGLPQDPEQIEEQLYDVDIEQSSSQNVVVEAELVFAAANDELSVDD